MTIAAGDRRIGQLADALPQRDVEWLIVSAPANVRYLAGYSGSNGVLAVAAARSDRMHSDRRDPDRRHLFLTDFRYETQAEQEVGSHAPSCERVIVTGDLIEAVGKLLSGEEPAGGESGAPSHVRAADEGAPPPPPPPPPRSSAARVGFDQHDLSVARHERLADALGERFELVGCGGMVEAMRQVKEPEEQRRIAAAAALADSALVKLLEGGLIGRSERQVAIELERLMLELGAQAASFPTIVASGAHGALPHAQPGEEQIQAGTLVTIDWGCILDGYCSDCTRTFAAGDASERAIEVYELVLAAQQAGLEALAPGRSGKEVDAVAREVIEQAGFGERFGHGLGHGVGIEIHEGPRLSRTAGDDPLQAGTVVTIEPGVYLPGELGVRIEDLVVVAAGEGSRNRNLSSLPKRLIVVS
jgi:Xaa-Pro aminopeptidase